MGVTCFRGTPAPSAVWVKILNPCPIVHYFRDLSGGFCKHLRHGNDLFHAGFHRFGLETIRMSFAVICAFIFPGLQVFCPFYPHSVVDSHSHPFRDCIQSLFHDLFCQGLIILVSHFLVSLFGYGDIKGTSDSPLLLSFSILQKICSTNPNAWAMKL